MLGIQKLEDFKDIEINQEMYNMIDKWKALYKGYLEYGPNNEPWHKVSYNTIGGMRTRRMQTLNMGKVVTEEMASLVFNEKCEISISDDSLKEEIENVFKQNKFYRKFQKELEFNFALGGMVVKPYVQNEEIRISYVQADCFIPISWVDDTITEGVFLSEIKKGKYIHTHLEWHLQSTDNKGQQGYTIKNDVYRRDAADSASGEIGVKVPLDTIFEGVEEEVGIHPLPKPLFTYFKPNKANYIDMQSPLGVSIFATSLDVMKAIDTMFDSFYREFRLGKKRIIVPSHMVKTIVDPEKGEVHRYFDPSDETYEALHADNMDTDKIHDISVELRVEEHVSAINAALNLFAMQTGFSAGTFSFDGKSVKTATEVISENSKTFKSKKSHEIIVESGLQDLIESIVTLAELYDIFSAPNPYEVTVSFDDSIVEDKNAELAKFIKEVASGLTPRKVAIMRYHGLTEEEADRWIEDIRSDQLEMDPIEMSYRTTNRILGDEE